MVVPVAAGVVGPAVAGLVPVIVPVEPTPLVPVVPVVPPDGCVAGFVAGVAGVVPPGGSVAGLTAGVAGSAVVVPVAGLVAGVPGLVAGVAGSDSVPVDNKSKREGRPRKNRLN